MINTYEIHVKAFKKEKEHLLELQKAIEGENPYDTASFIELQDLHFQKKHSEYVLKLCRQIIDSYSKEGII